jgi:hypothetical protein
MRTMRQHGGSLQSGSFQLRADLQSSDTFDNIGKAVLLLDLVALGIIKGLDIFIILDQFQLMSTKKQCEKFINELENEKG